MYPSANSKSTASHLNKTAKKRSEPLKDNRPNKPSAKARGKRKAVDPPSDQHSVDHRDQDDDDSRPTVRAFERTVASSLVAKSWRPLAADARQELLNLANDVGTEMLDSLPSTSSSARSKRDLDRLVASFSSELNTLLTTLLCPPLPASLRPRSKRTITEVELISEAVVEKRTTAAAHSMQTELAQIEVLENALEIERRRLDEDEARWAAFELAAVPPAAEGAAPARGLQVPRLNIGDEDEEEDEDEFGSWTPVVSEGAVGGKKAMRQRADGEKVELRGLASAAAPVPHFEASEGSPRSRSIPRKPLFDKILIANRGEIACRIIRTCRRLGIKTVAVFSEADSEAMHVKMADEAHLLGPAPSTLSYLNVPRILEICRQTGAQAVHPGYGFLSENAEFAQALEREGVVFVGPGEGAIRSMGSKAESKDIMQAAGVPCIPGWHPSTSPSNTPSTLSAAEQQSPAFLRSRADEIGYPVLIKAVSGGGGKGMKIVTHPAEFESQLESARREAGKSFGDERVLLERYVERPRHVEVQIFSDSHGNHLSLFERDCSVQRRHQKVIEEAPAPNLDPELRKRLWEAARRAARAVDYRGAGTVEFILNADQSGPDQEFFFLEVNTRLQVEHPVTEAITGIDLVDWQLEVAAGNPIPLRQDEIRCEGHAFEVRVYAENPRNGFLPDTGTLLHVRTPKESDSVRLETGFGAGDEISVHYDPLIAKLIVHGPTRLEALKRLRRALGEYQIVGPATNLEFLGRLAKHEAFEREELDTGFIQKHYSALFPPLPAPSASTLASAALFLATRDIAHYTSLDATSTWANPELAGFRLGGARYERRYALGEDAVRVGKANGGGGEGVGFDVAVSSSAEDDPTVFLDARPAVSPFSEWKGEEPATAATVTTLLAEQLAKVDIVSAFPSSFASANAEEGGEKLHLFNEAEGFAGAVEVKPPAWMRAVGSARGAQAGGGAGAGGARAPMPSKIVQVLVKEGDVVDEGDPLVVVEAMKTEHVLRAPKKGIVERVSAKEGDLVPEGKVLVAFVEEEKVECREEGL
ncbi:hypothetical protein JCM1840_001944 [Sporobolomyces johnsonii]